MRSSWPRILRNTKIHSSIHRCMPPAPSVLPHGEQYCAAFAIEGIGPALSDLRLHCLQYCRAGNMFLPQNSHAPCRRYWAYSHAELDIIQHIMICSITCTETKLLPSTTLQVIVSDASNHHIDRKSTAYNEILSHGLWESRGAYLLAHS